MITSGTLILALEPECPPFSAPSLISQVLPMSGTSSILLPFLCSAVEGAKDVRSRAKPVIACGQRSETLAPERALKPKLAAAPVMIGMRIETHGADHPRLTRCDSCGCAADLNGSDWTYLLL